MDGEQRVLAKLKRRQDGLHIVSTREEYVQTFFIKSAEKSQIGFTSFGKEASSNPLLRGALRAVRYSGKGVWDRAQQGQSSIGHQDSESVGGQRKFD